MYDFVRRRIDADIDSDIVELVEVMNCLPGIYTTSCCCGHGIDPVEIYFSIRPAKGQHQMGLFFLTRCCDVRYFKHDWKIYLSVGDLYRDYLPVNYVLSSCRVGDVAYSEAIDLVKNMKNHLNHENFIKGYNIDLGFFGVENI
jgi:hypothetical protein